MKSGKLVKNKSNAFKKKKSIKKGGSKRRYSKKRITKGGMAPLLSQYQPERSMNFANKVLEKSVKKLNNDIEHVAAGTIRVPAWRQRWNKLIEDNMKYDEHGYLKWQSQLLLTARDRQDRLLQMSLDRQFAEARVGLGPKEREKMARKASEEKRERVAAREREIERKEQMFEAVLAQKKYNENAQSVLLARSQRSKTPPFTAKQNSNRAAGKTRRNSTRNAAKKRRKQISKYLSKRPTTTRMSISPGIV